MHHRKVSRSELNALRRAFRYNARLGIVTWRTAGQQRGGFHYPGDEAGTLRPDGYIVISLAGLTLRAHHLAYLLMKGENVPDGFEIHHRDDNPWNNRWSNLEAVTRKKHRKYFKVDPTAYIHTSSAKRKAAHARVKSEEWQQAVRRPRTAEEIAKVHTPQAEAKRSASARRAWSDPTLRAEQSSRLKAHLADPKNYRRRVKQLKRVQAQATEAAAAKVKGSMWITNGEVGKRVPTDTDIPTGWRRGKPDYRSTTELEE